MDDISTKPQSGKPAQNGIKAKNTNRWQTRQLVTIALFCAIGVLLSFVEFPIIAGVSFLKYDASAMPAMVGGFTFGCGAGLAIGIVGAIIHGLLMADLWGSLMNIIVIFGFVVPASLVYSRMHTRKGAVIGLALSVICSTVLALLGNLLITPIYLGVPLESVIALMIPALLPFNLIKAVLNALLTLLIYKSISGLINQDAKQNVRR